jgi:DNA-binding winged helix-turn-helix (wHTH) protein
MTRNALLIGELKARRQALGWSLQEVGERCAIDELFLREWEGGSGSPRLEAIDAWASALGLKIALMPAESIVKSGLAIDWDRRRAAVDGSPVRLTPMEWKALERLAANPGEVVSHQALFRHLYGDNRLYEPRSTAIRVLITKLRRILPLRIEAQWGRGYVVNGIASSQDKAANDTAQREAALPLQRHEHAVSAAFALPRNGTPMLRAVGDDAERTPRRAEAPPHIAGQRSEELQVIERFLSERGATRCPDVGTIAQQPLPTLVWDKIKRKWVRPGVAGSARQAV